MGACKSCGYRDENNQSSENHELQLDPRKTKGSSDSQPGVRNATNMGNFGSIVGGLGMAAVSSPAPSDLPPVRAPLRLSELEAKSHAGPEHPTFEGVPDVQLPSDAPSPPERTASLHNALTTGGSSASRTPKQRAAMEQHQQCRQQLQQLSQHHQSAEQPAPPAPTAGAKAGSPLRPSGASPGQSSSGHAKSTRTTTPARRTGGVGVGLPGGVGGAVSLGGVLGGGGSPTGSPVRRTGSGSPGGQGTPIAAKANFRMISTYEYVATPVASAVPVSLAAVQGAASPVNDGADSEAMARSIANTGTPSITRSKQAATGKASSCAPQKPSSAVAADRPFCLLPSVASWLAPAPRAWAPAASGAGVRGVVEEAAAKGKVGVAAFKSASCASWDIGSSGFDEVDVAKAAGKIVGVAAWLRDGSRPWFRLPSVGTWLGRLPLKP